MKSKLALLIFALLFQVACMAVPLPALFAPTETVVPTSTSIPATPTLPPPPGVTPIPSETLLSPARLFQQVTLTEEPYSESGDSPVYTLETSTPVLEGSDDPRALEFNRQAVVIVDELVAEFKSGFEYLPDQPISAGSFFQVTFTQLAPPGDILSIQFGVDAYSDGAAHPYHLTRTLNFNLETGQVLTLEALFLPDVDYLVLIADHCRAELATRDIGFEYGFESGAAPLPENYRNWNLTYEGLLVTFDEYQVASYAAGMQQVLVPYGLLQEYFSEDFAGLIP
ncbi:MAG: RsiV family protein [Anaerolineae bacterium]|nr:RsiV family protein [Anaerolineae bacterium]